MSEEQFEDFDLTFDRVGDLYRPRVSQSVVGEVAGTPFSASGLPDLTSDPESLAGDAREVGKHLYQAAFDRNIQQALDATQEVAESRWRNLRVRLHLAGAPELARLPWELLYHPEQRKFVSLESPLVRFVESAMAPVRKAISLPVRIAVAGGTQEDLTDLEQALGDPLRKGQVVIESLDPSTPEVLRKRLHQGLFQVFHIIGHGSSEPDDTQERGQSSRISIKELVDAFRNNPSRLVLLNAAHSDEGHSTAEGIVKRGSAAAVVHMPLQGQAGRHFTHAFYNQLLEGEPVEAAVSQARRALNASMGSATDWGAPVLYSGVSRGESFRVTSQGDSLPLSVGSTSTTRGQRSVRSDDRGAPPPPGEPPALRHHQPRPRYLQGRFQPRVRLGDTVALQVRIALSTGSEGSALLRDLDVPAEGLDARLVLYAPGFEILQGNQRTLRIPSTADSDWVPFEMKAVRTGIHSVDVTAYAGGAMLGNLVLEVTIDETLHTSEGQEYQQSFWPRLAPDEVSLSIRYDDVHQVYRFMLLDGTGRPPEEVTAERLQETPVEAVESLVKQLNDVARGQGKYTADQTRRWLRNKGIELWKNFIPQELQRQFWDLQKNIRRIVIVSDKNGDPVPWELLYPFRPGHSNDGGFFAEQFQVSRWIATRGGFAPPGLRLAHAAFVEPQTSQPLPRATQEIEAIQRLTSRRGARTGDIIKNFSSLMDLFTEGDFSLLHFACHNSYDSAKISMGGTPFQPVFLQEYEGHFSSSSPLVFLNACRSDVQTQRYTGLEGWARAFLEAGAGAFIGTLWVVRDETAAQFAEAFYSALLGPEPRSLGQALQEARQAIREVPGDPTWLAYTLYGNTAAVLG